MCAYRQIWLLWYHSTLLTVAFTTSSWTPEVLKEDDSEPYFGDPIGNITVALGKEAVLACTVINLGHFKVGWLRAEDQTVLSLDTKVVTHNQRVLVSRDDDTQTWRLHIRQLRPSDKGCYMCQINTSTMKKQIGCLDVHVPPSIEDEGTSGDLRVDEGRNVSLQCLAKGHPPPRITWRREDSKALTLYTLSAGFISVDSYVGARIDMVKVDHSQMGAYFCIASNDIPPSVSKRIVLQIDFAPISTEPTQRLGAMLGGTIELQCEFYAFPSDNTTWRREIAEIHEYGGDFKIEVTRYSYHVTMTLTVRNLRPMDFGRYYCSVSNAKGTARATIQLYEVRPETTTTSSTTTILPTTVKDTESSESDNTVDEMMYYNEVDSLRRDGSGGVVVSGEPRSRSYIVSSSVSGATRTCQAVASAAAISYLMTLMWTNYS